MTGVSRAVYPLHMNTLHFHAILFHALEAGPRSSTDLIRVVHAVAPMSSDRIRAGLRKLVRAGDLAMTVRPSPSARGTCNWYELTERPQVSSRYDRDFAAHVTGTLAKMSQPVMSLDLTRAVAPKAVAATEGKALRREFRKLAEAGVLIATQPDRPRSNRFWYSLPNEPDSAQ